MDIMDIMAIKISKISCIPLVSITWPVLVRDAVRDFPWHHRGFHDRTVISARAVTYFRRITMIPVVDYGRREGEKNQNVSSGLLVNSPTHNVRLLVDIYS
jgi:hypothetical protein